MDNEILRMLEIVLPMGIEHIDMSVHGHAILSDIDSVISFRNSLADEKSKQLLDKLIVMRLASCFLPFEDVYKMFGVYSQEKWDSFIKIAQTKTDFPIPNDYLLDRIETWVLDGYRYDDVCCVQDGDIVIDGGAYTGNTACYFAQQTGINGKVFSFEAAPDTFMKLKENINNIALDNIFPINMALNDRTETTFFSGNEPGSKISSENTGIEIRCISLDEFVDAHNLERVDFIKLDIEGHEEQALMGAKGIICKYRPKMAICIYHKAEDLINLPKLILSIHSGYDFYLKHNSNSVWETVLFCVPTDNPMQQVAKENDGGLVLSVLRHLITACKKRNIDVFFEKLEIAFKQIVDFPIKMVRSSGQTSLFIPLSLDNLRYEFFFHDNSIMISILFETSNYAVSDALFSIIKEKKDFLQEGLPSPLKFGKFGTDYSFPAVFFSVPRQSDEHAIRLYAKIMKVLMSRSLPLFCQFSGVLDETLAQYCLDKACARYDV